MFSSIFSVIQLLLKLIGLWESFCDWSDKKRTADAEANLQKLHEAVDKQKNAATEDEFDKAQDSIVSHKPKP